MGTVYEKIPEKDAVLLVRALGLLVNQAGIYGPSHKVTQNAARCVFAELEQATKAYGLVEITLKDNRVLVNGSFEGLDESAGKNLRDRMFLHKIGGLVFLSPPDLNEFLVCIALFGTPPQKVADEGGFEVAMQKAALRSIRVVTVSYQRVEGGEPPPSPPSTPPPAAEGVPVAVPKSPGVAHSSRVGVLDLSAALEKGLERGPEEPEKQRVFDISTPALARKERASALATLLRDTAALLEHEDMLSDEEQHQKVLEALNRIRDMLAASTAASERQIAVLADQVDGDRLTIASIESAARRRGIGLKISRSELVERYAELNQEIVQPLTVSSGVIDMLYSGKGGPLTEEQRDLLKLASDSVDRVNQLVAYMHRIAGLPESLNPNAAIIADSYR